jgi:hypothetical protein
MGPRPRVRTVCERIAEQLCDGTDNLPTLGHPFAPVVLVQGGCDRFSTVEKRRWGRATLVSKP